MEQQNQTFDTSSNADRSLSNSSPSEPMINRSMDHSTDEEMKSSEMYLRHEALSAIIARCVAEEMDKRFRTSNIPPSHGQSISSGTNPHRDTVLRPIHRDEAPRNLNDSWSPDERPQNRMVFSAGDNPTLLRNISPIKPQEQGKPYDLAKQVSNFKVEHFKTDSDSPDKGFRRWRQKFEETLELNYKVHKQRYPNDIVLLFIKKYTDGHTRNWLRSNERNLAGKSTTEMLDAIQRYLSVTADFSTITKYLENRTKKPHETFIEHKDRLLDGVDCLPGGVELFSNVNLALHYFLIHCFTLTGKQSIEGCASTRTEDPWGEFDKAIDHIHQVTKSDGTNYVPITKKNKPKHFEERQRPRGKRKAKDANLAQVQRKPKASRNPTEEQKHTEKRPRDYSDAMCYICNQKGHTTNHHIRSKLPGTYHQPDPKRKAAEVSFAVKSNSEDDPNDQMIEGSLTEGSSDESVCDVLLVESSEIFGDLPEMEINEVVATSQVWGLDSCASVHLTHIKEALMGIQTVEPIRVRVADGTVYTTSLAGTVTLERAGRLLTLKNVYYLPEVPKNLISVGKLSKENFSVRINKNVAKVTKDGAIKAKFNSRNGIFVQRFHHE